MSMITVRPGVLRTPPEYFADLPDFDFPVSTAEVRDPDVAGATLRMAYLDLGDPAAPAVLLLHGEPTWSYLYRRVIPPLLAAGLRVVAPDLIGFGRSDKPEQVAAHTYARHLDWLDQLVTEHLDLSATTVVGQDWGGLLGLRLAVARPERVARFVAANTGLPDGRVPLPEIWHAFRAAVKAAPRLDIGRLVEAGCTRGLAAADRAGYDAPFPCERAKAGPRAMPELVPVTEDDPQAAANQHAWGELARWERPFLVAFSDRDPITGPMAEVLRRHIPGAAGRVHPLLRGAGHFLQEDAGPELGVLIGAFVQDDRLG